MAYDGLSCHQLVVEILEGGINDESILLDAVNYYRSLGALVALDDFGVGHSNFDRIWRLSPDIIKLDRSVISEATQHWSEPRRRMLPNLVTLMHEAGSMVLAEGIETQEQALVALDADVDLLQGFYMGHPAARMITQDECLPTVKNVQNRFAQIAQDNDRAETEMLSPYKAAFREAAFILQTDRAPASACAPLLRMARTARCYLLDEHGEVLFHYEAPAGEREADPRFRPIRDMTDGSWFGRPYFRAALKEARRLQVSRPYLSSIGSHMCLTLSISNSDVPRRVFCCDLCW